MAFSKTSAPFEIVRRLSTERGQSTVEAAVLLPTLMLLLSMLVQPVCMGYTRMIMAHAAAETLRVMATSPDEATARNYALRRLRAVPEASLFHAGADRDWQIQVGREDEGRVAVASIAGHVRPLPFFGILASAFGERDGQGVVLRVQVRGNVRPAWVGGDYGEWQEMWD